MGPLKVPTPASCPGSTPAFCSFPSSRLKSLRIALEGTHETEDALESAKLPAVLSSHLDPDDLQITAYDRACP